MDELSGYIDAIVYAQPENGFTVARLKEPRKKEFTIIVGYLRAAAGRNGRAARGRGKRTLPTGGSSRSASIPSRCPAIWSGFKNIWNRAWSRGSARLAKKIVDRFGADTLEVIDETPRSAVWKSQGWEKKRSRSSKSAGSSNGRSAM